MSNIFLSIHRLPHPSQVQRILKAQSLLAYLLEYDNKDCRTFYNDSLWDIEFPEEACFYEQLVAVMNLSAGFTRTESF